MKRGLLVFIAICAFAIAMAPRPRRAVNTEDDDEDVVNDTTAKPDVKICAHQTPCAWSIYSPHSLIIELNLTNSYCICESGTVCKINENDTVANAFVHRCRDPSQGDLS